MADELGKGEAIIFLVDTKKEDMEGSYNPNDNTIIFHGDENITNEVVSEELFHAMQYRVDPNIVSLAGTANLEFEPKLFKDLINQNNEPPLFNRFYAGMAYSSNQNYENWLEKLTNKGTMFPNNISQEDYLIFLAVFKDKYNSTLYANLPINDSSTPYTLLYLINLCNCTH